MSSYQGLSKEIPYWALRWFVKYYLSLHFKVKIFHKERIPKGKVIVAANHVSNIDPLAIGSFYPGRISYIAKKELFENKIQNWALTHLQSIKIDREAADRTAIKNTISLLKQDIAVGIFPEGSRSSDGEVSETKKGVALFSILADAPVIPAAIVGTKDFRDGVKFKPLIKRTPIFIDYGELIYPNDFKGSKKERIQKMTEVITNSMRKIKKELENLWEQ